MKERDIIFSFARALVEKPLSIVLLILDLAGVVAVAAFVIDDQAEGLIFFLFLAILLFSQYLVFRKMWREQQSYPRLVLSQVRQAQMYQKSAIVDRRTPTFHVIQVWFANQPVLPNDASIAREVTAKITIFSTDDDKQVLEYYGQWAQSNAPDNAGFEGYIEKVDIPPGHLLAKLQFPLQVSFRGRELWVCQRRNDIECRWSLRKILLCTRHTMLKVNLKRDWR